MLFFLDARAILTLSRGPTVAAEFTAASTVCCAFPKGGNAARVDLDFVTTRVRVLSYAASPQNGPFLGAAKTGLANAAMSELSP